MDVVLAGVCHLHSDRLWWRYRVASSLVEPCRQRNDAHHFPLSADILIAGHRLGKLARTALFWTTRRRSCASRGSNTSFMRPMHAERLKHRVSNEPHLSVRTPVSELGTVESTRYSYQILHCFQGKGRTTVGAHEYSTRRCEPVPPQSAWVCCPTTDGGRLTSLGSELAFEPAEHVIPRRQYFHERYDHTTADFVCMPNSRIQAFGCPLRHSAASSSLCRCKPTNSHQHPRPKIQIARA